MRVLCIKTYVCLDFVIRPQLLFTMCDSYSLQINLQGCLAKHCPKVNNTYFNRTKQPLLASFWLEISTPSHFKITKEIFLRLLQNSKLQLLSFIVIIIISGHQHRSPWPSPVTLLCHRSLPVDLQGYILYRH